MKLTKAQQAAFWKLFGEACNKTCYGHSDRDKDAYRHRIIYQSTGKISLKDVGRCTDFEKLMCALAVDAEDYQAAGTWATCGERRTVYYIKECARQIGEIKNKPHGWAYCRAIFTQANLPERWEDIPADSLWNVFCMLDTYRRRILRREGFGGKKEGQPLSFVATRIYFRSGSDVSFYDPTTA